MTPNHDHDLGRMTRAELANLMRQGVALHGRDDFASCLGTGAIVVFDEHIGYCGWRDRPCRVFREFVRAARIGYEYVAFKVFGKQAAVRLDGRG